MPSLLCSKMGNEMLKSGPNGMRNRIWFKSLESFPWRSFGSLMLLMNLIALCISGNYYSTLEVFSRFCARASVLISGWILFVTIVSLFLAWYCPKTPIERVKGYYRSKMTWKSGGLIIISTTLLMTFSMHGLYRNPSRYAWMLEITVFALIGWGLIVLMITIADKRIKRKQELNG